MKVFDFAVGWPVRRTKDELFIDLLESECRARDLSFLFVGGKSLEDLTGEVKKGNFKIKFYLDMASDTYRLRDKFTRFAYCLKDAGARVVADPDNVRAAADKSITHFNLVRAGISVPFTVVIRNWEPTRRLTEEERNGLGIPFVIKPALGYGQKGVKIISQRRPLKEIAEAREFNPGDNFLLQELVEPAELGGSPAWFRVYYLFGEIILCWWHPVTHVYRQVTLKEMGDYNLLPLVRMISEIARVTRVDWFSSEIAMSKKGRKFTVIDYMNDQFAVSPQSRYKNGLPNDLIAHVAARTVEKAWQYTKGSFTLTYRAVWLPRIKVRDEDV